MDTFGFKLHVSQMQMCVMWIIMPTLHGFYTFFFFKGVFLCQISEAYERCKEGIFSCVVVPTVTALIVRLET